MTTSAAHVQHSPTSYCFSLFDRLMMLVRGHVVYFGSTSECAAGGVCLCVHAHRCQTHRATHWLPCQCRSMPFLWPPSPHPPAEGGMAFATSACTDVKEMTEG